MTYIPAVWSGKRHTARECLASIGWALVPSVFQGLPPKRISPNSSRKRSTEYLDGLRGLASLFVFNFHWAKKGYPNASRGWGFEGQTSILQMPFIKTFMAGHAMVPIFFVISGYVLSHRFVVLMHSQRHVDLEKGLTSLAFRRFIRLFLPCVVVTFMSYTLRIMGVRLTAEELKLDFWGRTRIYLTFLKDFLDVWTWEPQWSGYDGHLWTIPVEFKCSVILFLIVLSLQRCKTWVRLTLEAIVFIQSFCIYMRYYISLFMGGMMLAEVTVLYDKYIQSQYQLIPNDETVKEEEDNPQERAYAKRHWAINAALWIALTGGIYLSGFSKHDGVDTPGYRFVKNIWPFDADYKRHVIYTYAAILINWSVAFLLPTQRFLCTRWVKFLGRISFSLYLIHGPLQRILGHPLLKLTWAITGTKSYHSFNLGFAMASFIYIPIVLWLADLFTTAVDLPTLTFGRWVERKCFQPDEEVDRAPREEQG